MEHILTMLLHQIWQVLNYDISPIIDRIADAFVKSYIIPPFNAYVLPRLHRLHAWLEGPALDAVFWIVFFTFAIGGTWAGINSRGPYC